MSEPSVALDAVTPEDAQARLLGALSAGGARASALDGAAEGAWFLFDTPRGAGAFRPLSLGGVAAAPPVEADGAGAAALVEGAEGVLAGAERALGVAIAPHAVGPAPGGVGALVEQAGTVLALSVPQSLAETLPPSAAPAGTVLHRVRLAAPALGPADIPGAGDLLLLGAQAPCEVMPLSPHGAAGFAATLTAGPGEGAVLAGGGGTTGAVVAFEALLTPGQQAAARGGAALTLGPGEAPPATYAGEGGTRTGRLVPLGGAVAFRFD